MSAKDLREAEHEAIREAAPVAVGVAAALGALAAVSAHAGWELVGGVGWWLWAVTAAAWLVLALVLLVGLGSGMGRHDVRRHATELLLAVVVLLSIVQTGLLVASLINAGEVRVTGPQLLQSGATLWLSNVVAFGLAFWTLDADGPVKRAMAERRIADDFAFPQDGDDDLGPRDWKPHLGDYLYVSLTNSIAFSPTDTMPLTRKAKGLMGLGALVSAVTLLLVAARAVNILG
ncbi:MAG TPA: hypothetical protein VL422_18360 [Miltoncostaea sp.]|nr:hypothetical protein [Miltoncostaea sp.]